MAEQHIYRTVNIDGETYGPGQEEEMLEHLKAQDEAVPGHDHEKELARMEKAGFIEGFVDLGEDERTNEGTGTADERASRRAQVEERTKTGKNRSRKTPPPLDEPDDDR